MAKFRVGDQVVRTTKSYSPSRYGLVGHTYEVLAVNTRGFITVVRHPDGEDGYWAFPNGFDLVSEAKSKPKRMTLGSFVSAHS